MVREGDPAPDFQLENDLGGTLGPADFAGKRWVLYFYPRDNTSGCTAEAKEFQERLGALAGLGVDAVVGVSRDSLRSHARFRERHGLTFPLLTDPDHAVHEAYGAWGEKKMYGKVTRGVLRTTVVVGPDGRIERVYTKVRAKGHAQRVLEDLGS